MTSSWVMGISEIEVNGISLYYKKKGKGKPVYVLHGGPGFDHRYFGESLAELESIRELYYIDFRGHGKSSKAEKKTYTFETFTDDIEALRNKLGHGTIEIFGHSMGGIVALLYSLRYPTYLDTLILVGAPPKQTSIQGHYALKIKLLHLNFKYYLKYKISKTLDIEAFAKEILLTSWPIYVPKSMLSRYEDYIHSLQGLEIFFDMQKELMKFDISQELEHIQQPTLVIFGENDVFLDSGRLLKNIKHSKFSVIPMVKHLPFLEDEKRFNMVIREFLSGTMV